MPYFSATYATIVDKIFATMGPYIVRCNPITGAKEALTRLGAPIYGELTIVYHPGTGRLFVGSGTTPNKQSTNSWALDPPVYKDLYMVNPSTMAITACGIMANVYNGFGPHDGLYGGPYGLHADGNYVYFTYRFMEGSAQWCRVRATDYAYNGGCVRNWVSEHLATDTNYVYLIDPAQTEIERCDKTGVEPGGGYVDSFDVTPCLPVACCVGANGKLYVVGGDDSMWRVDYSGPSLTELFLGPVQAGADPCRIRRLSDGKLYLPCMSQNGIIVWNTATETGIWKGGFETPIDVVETATKKFAVQAAPVGLKEIT